MTTVKLTNSCDVVTFEAGEHHGLVCDDDGVYFVPNRLLDQVVLTGQAEVMVCPGGTLTVTAVNREAGEVTFASPDLGAKVAQGEAAAKRVVAEGTARAIGWGTSRHDRRRLKAWLRKKAKQ